MEECWNEDCEKHDVFMDNNCRLYKNIENCADRKPLIAETKPVDEVPCSAGLDPEDIEIMKAQKEIKSLGWQWKERIYNDHFGKSADCYTVFTKETNPCWDGELRELGWGRTPRLNCWRCALAYIKRQEGA